MLEIGSNRGTDCNPVPKTPPSFVLSPKGKGNILISRRFFVVNMASMCVALLPVFVVCG